MNITNILVNFFQNLAKDTDLEEGGKVQITKTMSYTAAFAEDDNADFLMFTDNSINRGGIFVFDYKNNQKTFFPLYIKKDDNCYNLSYAECNDVITGDLNNKYHIALETGQSIVEKYTLCKFIFFFYLSKIWKKN